MSDRKWYAVHALDCEGCLYFRGEPGWELRPRDAIIDMEVTVISSDVIAYHNSSSKRGEPKPSPVRLLVRLGRTALIFGARFTLLANWLRHIRRFLLGGQVSVVVLFAIVRHGIFSYRHGGIAT